MIQLKLLYIHLVSIPCNAYPSPGSLDLLGPLFHKVVLLGWWFHTHGADRVFQGVVGTWGPLLVGI